MTANKIIEMEKLIESSANIRRLDFFFCSLSNENRGYRTLDILISMGIDIANIVFIKYDKFVLTYDIEAIKKKYGVKSNITIISCKKDEDCIEISKMNASERDLIGFDITSFAIPDVFKILFVFKEVLSFKNINVYYTEPKYYCYQNGLLSTDTSVPVEREYKVIEEYNNSGVGKKETLICFLGFDRLVSKYVHEKADPTDIVIINGFPSYMPKLKDISLLSNYELITTVGKDKVRSVRANSPFAVFNCLNEVGRNYKDTLMNICVLGTKPMALGAALYALDHKRNVKVTYPYPKEYTLQETSEYDATWRYSINL